MEQVIAVGAVDSTDHRCGYSNYGVGMDICGVSHTAPEYCYGYLITTDQMDSAGINPGICPGGDSATIDYTFRTSGTSAACPQVSGVAALILSRRPDFIKSKPEWPDTTTTATVVKQVLYGSAEDVWVDGWDQWTGHGRVNAYRALLSVIRGDVTNDGQIDALDLALLIDMLFAGGHAALDDRTGDWDRDGFNTAFDLGGMIDYLYGGGPLPEICFAY